MLRTAFVVALGLQACGPRSPESERPGESASEADGKRERKANANAATAPGPGCPARFDYAMQGSACTPAGHCTYAEAECWCHGKQACTGVDLGDDARGSFEWSCRVGDPAVKRPDGCPAKVPEQGLACRKNGQVCVYSPYCGGIQSTGRCTSGAWQLEEIEVSAPPSSEG
jgi:hypothetical protein